MYGVEINYNDEPCVKGIKYFSKVEAVWLNDCYYLTSDIEMDKISAQVYYNCHISHTQEYDLVISKTHLQPKIYNQVRTSTLKYDVAV